MSGSLEAAQVRRITGFTGAKLHMLTQLRQLLVAAGINVNAARSSGAAPLHLSCLYAPPHSTGASICTFVLVSRKASKLNSVAVAHVLPLRAALLHRCLHAFSVSWYYILLYMCPLMCPHTTICVSSYYILLYMCPLICPHTTICVLILQTTIYVSSYVSSYYYMCVLMCPHTTTYVSSYVSLYYYICVLICVLILLYVSSYVSSYYYM
jgi:hypothetical protein